MKTENIGIELRYKKNPRDKLTTFKPIEEFDSQYTIHLRRKDGKTISLEEARSIMSSYLFGFMVQKDITE